MYGMNWILARVRLLESEIDCKAMFFILGIEARIYRVPFCPVNNSLFLEFVLESEARITMLDSID